ncbi:MAG: cytochrome c-type biogenesis protein [Pseudomonadota bacterium]
MDKRINARIDTQSSVKISTRIKNLIALLPLLILSLLLAPPLAAREAQPLVADEKTEQRMLLLADELRCLVCQNESLVASHADLAKDLRQEIRTQIKQGRSDAEIMQFMVERYGDFVRYRPPFNRSTWLLWFGPALLLLLACISLFYQLGKNKGGQQQRRKLSREEQQRAEQLLALPEPNAGKTNFPSETKR